MKANFLVTLRTNVNEKGELKRSNTLGYASNAHYIPVQGVKDGAITTEFVERVSVLWLGPTDETVRDLAAPSEHSPQDLYWIEIDADELLTVTTRDNMDLETQEIIDEEDVGYVLKNDVIPHAVTADDGQIVQGLISRVTVLWEKRRSPAPAFVAPEDLVFVGLTDLTDDDDDEDVDQEAGSDEEFDEEDGDVIEMQQ